MFTKGKDSSEFLDLLSLKKKYPDIEAMFTNKAKLAQFRRHLYNKAIELFPTLKEKNTKKLMS